MMTSTYDVGQMVRFTQREGEDPCAAIVTKSWEDGTYGLFVFSLEANTQVRAALPVQISPASTTDFVEAAEMLLSQQAELTKRVSALEEQMERLLKGNGEVPDVASTSASKRR